MKRLRVGGRVAAKASRRSSAVSEELLYWRLKALDNAFYFYIQEKPDTYTYLEYDMLTGEGAFKEKPSWLLKRVLDYLDELEPGYAGIILEKNIKLLRRRLGEIGSGILEVVSGEEKNFHSDTSLSMINFYDYYKNLCQSEKSVSHNGNIAIKEGDGEERVIN